MIQICVVHFQLQKTLVGLKVSHFSEQVYYLRNTHTSLPLFTDSFLHYLALRCHLLRTHSFLLPPSFLCSLLCSQHTYVLRI